MELAFTLKYLKNQRGIAEDRSIEDAARLCAAAGFRYVDYSPDYTRDDWEACAYHDLEVLNSYGLSVEQTHAPMNRYGRYPEELFPIYFDRLFKASKILGAKCIAVHADEYRTVDHYDSKEAETFAYGYLAPYADYCAKTNMVMAIENLFEDKIQRCPQFNGRSRFGSTIEEIRGLVDRFNAPEVGVCWDFGHAKCAFGNEEMLPAFKSICDKLVCTHVHDNYYGHDLHLMPYLGEIDWDSHLKAMKVSGYKGKFSFEFVYGRFPDDLLPVWLTSVKAVGDYMMNLYERY